MAAVRHPHTKIDRKASQRRRGRQANPEKLRFILQHKFGNASYARFAAFIAVKKWTTVRGCKRARLPSYSTVLRFCRGDRVDESTLGLLCDELGVPFSLLRKGTTLCESDLKDTGYKCRWSFCHPASYSGQVWIQVVPKFKNHARPHHYTVRWGPWEFSSALNVGRLESVRFSHMKGHDGLSIPIFFDISPPCSVVSVGEILRSGWSIRSITVGFTSRVLVRRPPV
jgi:hypothetical protein